ncbi:MAG TPA: ISKra4 family transposase [Anaerolineae bacterium]|nr:ISKra4 family transposase [Anaerolineae bacterium]
MDDTTEWIQALAQQIGLVVKQSLSAATDPQAATSLAWIETALRDVLRQVGAQALGQLLSAAPSTPLAELPCACGGTLQYQRTRSATVLSVFGRVTYERAYYAGCPCGQGYAPVDEKYGLHAGQVSAGLAELLTLAGVELAFDHSRRWLKGFLLFDVSENTIRQETQALGQEQAAHETCLRDQSQDPTWLQAHLRTTAPIPARLSGSFDAAKVRIEPRKLAEKQAETEAWRDLKVGCWYEAEPVPARHRSARQRAVTERGQLSQRAKNIRYSCDIAEAQTFGKLMWATGCAAQADLTRELVFVCDGAGWIWNLITTHYPKAVQIVDWYHAADRLHRVAHAAFNQAAPRERWLERTTTDLWEGRVTDVSQACAGLAAQCSEAQEATTYFTNNAARMRYDQYRADGYLIGRGTVESSCKQIVTQRLKCSGAQWIIPGAVDTAKARAAWLSEAWTPVCTRWSDLPLAI